MHQTPARPATFTTSDAIALVAGVALLCAGFAVIARLSDWVNHWGAIPVYLAYFLLMSVAARLFWKGADAAIAALKHGVRKR